MQPHSQGEVPYTGVGRGGRGVRLVVVEGGRLGHSLGSSSQLAVSRRGPEQRGELREQNL